MTKKPDANPTYTIVLTNNQHVAVKGDLAFEDGLVVDKIDGQIRFAAPYSSVLYVTTDMGQPKVTVPGESQPPLLLYEDDENDGTTGEEIPF